MKSLPPGCILRPEDVPLAQVGNLIMSPSRQEPVLIADCVPVARQIAAALNTQARSESADVGPDGWLKLQ
jgi:hypothetical protein